MLLCDMPIQPRRIELDAGVNHFAALTTDYMKYYLPNNLLYKVNVPVEVLVRGGGNTVPHPPVPTVNCHQQSPPLRSGPRGVLRFAPDAPPGTG